MTDDEFFFGIMVRKDGKWKPHSKYSMGAFGTAMLKAEEMDKEPGSDGVKLVKITAKNPAEQAEVWISPHLTAAAKAQSSTQVRKGAQATKQNLAAAHAAAHKKK